MDFVRPLKVYARRNRVTRVKENMTRAVMDLENA